MTDRGDAPDRGGAPGRLHADQAIYWYGVMRARTWRGARAGGIVRIRYRDIEALVRPAPYEMPRLDETAVLAHQRVVENAMRRGTVLPAPFGIVFRGRRPLIRVLEDQYLALDEGLSFLDHHWELRLHMAAAAGFERDEPLVDLATQLYSELRRHARAAVTFPAEGSRMLSAAFLVDRSAWLEFMDRAERLGAAHTGIAFDVTGPWPPYDFIRIIV